MAEMEGQVKKEKIDIQDLKQQDSMITKEKELITTRVQQMTGNLDMMRGFNNDYIIIIEQNKRDVEFKSQSRSKEINSYKREKRDIEEEIKKFPLLLEESLHLASRNKNKLKAVLAKCHLMTRDKVRETLDLFHLEE